LKFFHYTHDNNYKSILSDLFIKPKNHPVYPKGLERLSQPGAVAGEGIYLTRLSPYLSDGSDLKSFRKGLAIQLFGIAHDFYKVSHFFELDLEGVETVPEQTDERGRLRSPIFIYRRGNIDLVDGVLINCGQTGPAPSFK
jgi:hypothetical protein